MDSQHGNSLVSHRRFVDPDQYAEAFRRGDSIFSVLQAGSYTSELTTVRVGRLTVQCGKESLARLFSTSMPPNVVGILGWNDGSPLPVVRGAQMRRGEWHSRGLGMESHHRTAGPVDFMVLTLEANDLTRSAIEMTGTPLFVGSGKVLRVPEHLGSWLSLVIKTATRAAITAPEMLVSPLSAEALEHALLRPMIMCLMHGEPSTQGLLHDRRVAVAKKFQAEVEANFDRPLLMSTLCRNIGVSERTLRTLCQEQLGISPLRFLALRRLHLARRALLRAEHHSTSVTSIALDHGIWELGRFAVTYKSVFGESPSATLRRPRVSGEIAAPALTLANSA